MDLAGNGMEAGVARVRWFLSRTTQGFAEFLVSEPTYMTILDMVLDAKCDNDCK